MLNMTIPQVLDIVAKAGKPLSQRQLYRYLKVLNIQPIGTNQRPQLYPGDTANRVLNHLGLNQPLEKGRILSLKQIKSKAKGGRK